MVYSFQSIFQEVMILVCAIIDNNRWSMFCHQQQWLYLDSLVFVNLWLSFPSPPHSLLPVSLPFPSPSHSFLPISLPFFFLSSFSCWTKGLTHVRNTLPWIYTPSHTPTPFKNWNNILLLCPVYFGLLSVSNFCAFFCFVIFWGFFLRQGLPDWLLYHRDPPPSACAGTKGATMPTSCLSLVSS